MSKPAPKRVTVFLPSDDESLMRWFDVQSSKSGSVRVLIAEAVKRYGYVDVMSVDMLKSRLIDVGDTSDTKNA